MDKNYCIYRIEEGTGTRLYYCGSENYSSPLYTERMEYAWTMNAEQANSMAMVQRKKSGNDHYIDFNAEQDVIPYTEILARAKLI